MAVSFRFRVTDDDIKKVATKVLVKTGVMTNVQNVISGVNRAISTVRNVISNIDSALSGLNNFLVDQPEEEKKYLSKYKVENFIIMKGDEKIELDHSNILSIEYLNNYDFHIMSMLKVQIKIDIRKRIFILKNKKDILVKFELNRFGVDTDVESDITAPGEIWNSEFSVYFSDDDELSDIGDLENRIKANVGDETKINDIEDENYFESQNSMDLYLFNPTLLKASRYSSNKIYEATTMQNIIGQMLTESKHENVLMSKIENDETYEELLLPANPLYKNLIYLDQYYGLYEKGALIFYDIDCLYIINLNEKVTAKREEEWTEVVFLVKKINSGIPGSGMIIKEEDKTFYLSVTEMDVNVQKSSIGKNMEIGSRQRIVTIDGTTIDDQDGDQSYIDERIQNIVYIKRSNKYYPSTIKARMDENESIVYINGNNFDMAAFKPNRIYKLVYDEVSKQEKYGKNKYRLSYAYHYLKLESEGFMTSSHKLILKKIEGEVENSDTSNNNS
jgi:hypothetical protein